MKTVIACAERPSEAHVHAWQIDFKHCMACPVCKKVYYSSDNAYTFEDYVSNCTFLKGMLWCFNCKKQGRFVIDDYAPSVDTHITDVHEKYPEYVHIDPQYKYFYEVTFARILCVVDSSLYGYCSTVKLPRCIIAEIMTAVTDTYHIKGRNHQELKRIKHEVLKKHNITKPDIDEDEIPDTYAFNMALECGSYNAFSPSGTQYPPAMELNHSGACILLQCMSDVTGNVYTYTMWGD